MPIPVDPTSQLAAKNGHKNVVEVLWSASDVAEASVDEYMVAAKSMVAADAASKQAAAKSADDVKAASLLEAAANVEGTAEEHKKAGNAHFKARRYKEAAESYSNAILLDNRSQTLYSNRCATFLALGEGERALEDALKARAINPLWAKAHYRVGQAFMAVKRWEDAGVAFFDGLKLDPKNESFKKAVQNAVSKGREEHAKVQEAQGGGGKAAAAAAN